MNRAAMAYRLRRRLNEQVPNYWDTALDINLLLNDALANFQRKVLRTNPLAFLAWYRFPLTANESFYRKPVGTKWIFSLEVKQTGGNYQELDPKPYRVARDWTGSSQVWANMGNFMALYPAPKETVVEGGQIIHCPTLTMADDDAVPEIDQSFHTAIVVWANKLALADVPETPAKAEVAKELAEEIADIPIIYGRSDLSMTERIWLDDQGLGRMPVGSTGLQTNSWWQRR